MSTSIHTLARKILHKVNLILRSLYRGIVLKTRALEQYAPKPLNIPKSYFMSAPNIDSVGLPTISIVTPSYNQIKFIGRTIQSVLSQNYPKLEYIIQDGASDDGSVDVIKSFAGKIDHFESRMDGGQAHAINLGFDRTRGEIMAYLNSDDLLMPGTLWYVASYFKSHPDVDVIYSHRIILDENDQEIGRWVLPPHDKNPFLWADYIPQETMFWRRNLWEKVGGKLDETFQFAMDWDLIVRFHQKKAKFVRVPRFLAAFRAHAAQKTNLYLNETGLIESDRIRWHIHQRVLTSKEIADRLRSYFLYSFAYHVLFRLGIIHY